MIKFSSKGLEHLLNDNKLDDKYQVLIVEKDVNVPFTIDDNILAYVSKIDRKYSSDSKKARVAFDWMVNNCKYKKDGWFRHKYKNSSEVMSGRKGVCADFAFLYISMMRSIGMDSGFVYVNRDFKNKRVEHACAYVELSKTVLVDPAYQTYDIKHRKYEFWSDKETIKYFDHWKGRKAWI